MTTISRKDDSFKLLGPVEGCRSYEIELIDMKPDPLTFYIGENIKKIWNFVKISPDNEPNINVTAANPVNQPPTVVSDGPQSVQAQETKASKKETKESAPKPNQDES